MAFTKILARKMEKNITRLWQGSVNLPVLKVLKNKRHSKATAEMEAFV